jgi:hypothetical protein
MFGFKLDFTPALPAAVQQEALEQDICSEIRSLETREIHLPGGDRQDLAAIRRQFGMGCLMSAEQLDTLRDIARRNPAKYAVLAAA